MTLEVPPKKEIIVYAPLTLKQETFYKAVVDKSISKLLGQENTVTHLGVLFCFGTQAAFSFRVFI